MTLTPHDQRQEHQRLAKTLAVIEAHLAALGRENRGDSKELDAFLWYMGENRRQMDGAEKASLRQMAGVLDYNWD